MCESQNGNIMEKTLSTKRVFDGIILHVDHMTNQLPNGHTAPREVARHIGAAAVVPVDDAGNVWLVKQFRAPIDDVLLEIPAGKLDYAGEDRQSAAMRELEEETGLTAGRWVHLTDLLTTPGFTDEKIGLYLALDLKPGRSHPDEDEFLNVIRMPLKEAVAAVVRGEITDGKTALGLLLAERALADAGR